MNVKSSSAMKAYGTTQFNGNSEREQEAHAFTMVVGAMERAMQDPSDRGAYYKALNQNQKLWTAIKISMFDPEHELPEALKKNMLRLGIYVDRTTRDLIADFNKEELQTLININKSLILGLRGIKPDQQRAF